jgi:hypothetical protein
MTPSRRALPKKMSHARETLGVTRQQHAPRAFGGIHRSTTGSAAGARNRSPAATVPPPPPSCLLSPLRPTLWGYEVGSPYISKHTGRGLYREAFERDSCGFELIASLDDKPSHWLVQTAISSLNRLTHRGAIATDGKTGDGCRLLLKKPKKFLRAVARDAKIKLSARFASGLLCR